MNLKQIVIENPLLAIMRNVPVRKATEYASALIDAEITFFEVALNSENALEEIALLKKNFGKKAIIGAGTAITIDRAKAAIQAGAQFLLSPSTDKDVLAYCKSEKIPMLPGALTPTDVSTCLQYGFSVIKLFPAGDMPKGYIKSLKGPFDETEYVAIGGVNADNIDDFIRQGYLGVGLGSNLLPKEAVKNEDWAAASEYAATLLNKIRDAKALKNS